MTAKIRPNMRHNPFRSFVLAAACALAALGPGAARQDAAANADADTDAARQARTLDEMAVVGAAWFSWLTDQVGAAAAGRTTAPGAYDLGALDRRLDGDGLAELLTAGASGIAYLESVPATDAWGGAYDFRMATRFTSARFMAIRSSGADGEPDGEVFAPGAFAAGEYDRDLVWADGYFLRWPEGAELRAPRYRTTPGAAPG